jgi:hypothetical protein
MEGTIHRAIEGCWCQNIELVQDAVLVQGTELISGLWDLDGQEIQMHHIKQGDIAELRPQGQSQDLDDGLTMGQCEPLNPTVGCSSFYMSQVRGCILFW